MKLRKETGTDVRQKVIYGRAKKLRRENEKGGFRIYIMETDNAVSGFTMEIASTE